jgi:PAS domain S-box-containing protein
MAHTPSFGSQAADAADSAARDFTDALLVEQARLLELIATGAPLDACLIAVTDAVSRLEPGTRACVLLADRDRQRFSDIYAADVPESFGAGLEGAPIDDLAIGTCGEAVFCGKPIDCTDIAHDERWSEPWRRLCLSHGIEACHSEPIMGTAGLPLGSLMLCFDRARAISPREQRIADFGVHVASIAIERDRSGQALRESEERYRHIVESAREYAIITLDGEGAITSWNSGAERLLGYSETEAIGQSGDIFFTPEDRAADRPEQEMRLARTEGRATNERWHLRKDGSRFWGSGVMLPVIEGDEARYLKIFRDGTEERAAERRQALLIDELNHRVKNTLALVQSLARQSLRGDGRAADARDAFEGRLQALATAHDLLTSKSWAPVELTDLVYRTLEGCYGNPDHVSVDGPPLALRAKTAVTIAMALHELCTNAGKYGALSTDAGRVAITWSITAQAPPRLALRWEERGGPPVAPPERRGFGTRLIEGGLAYELDGNVRLDFSPEGVVCDIDAPLPDDPDLGSADG